MTVGEWDERQLCADGGCIGVIGPTGTCKVCGRAAPNWGDERKRGQVAPLDATGDEDDDDTRDDEDDEGADAAEAGGTEATAADAGEDDRALCPDGGCIGLIGADGRCKVCGKRGTPPVAAGPAKDSEAISSEPPPLDEPEPERKLCPDGACVGLIGANGTCNVCGKAADAG